ncbi:MAG: hypothetical protein K2G03_01380 [Bacilli bacterium]|nr:hypothetical protein [Bacilli bacterium]
MLRGELEIIKKEFANIYNNFKRFQTAIGNRIHLNKLLPLLEKNPFLLLPSEYKLSNNIIDNVIKSYKYYNANQSLETDEKKCILEACNFYHSFLEKRLTSSIPRVYGITEDHYSYEVLKLDDPLIMTLGYETGCCFRLNGESKEFLKYCSESPHGRVILIKNDKDEICGMIPIIRNGNVINGNSIEKNSKGSNFKIYSALKLAFESILAMSAYYEEKPIIACLVTNLHSNCFSHTQIKNNIYPIRDTDFYTNYENTTYIVSSNPHVSENNFQFYTPEAIYYDERPNILVHHCNIKNNPHKQEIDNRIKSILYKLHKDTQIITPYTKYIVCSEDWFIKYDWNGISGECLDKDPRATEEYNVVKSYLKKRFSKDDSYYIDFEDTDLTGEGVTALIPKKLLLEDAK